MNRLIEYKSIKKDGQGGIKFDQKNPNVLEFDIDGEDRGFTQNMVGGEIIIPNLYKVDGYEDFDNDDAILDEIDDIEFDLPEEPPIPPDLPDEDFEEVEVEQVVSPMDTSQGFS